MLKATFLFSICLAANQIADSDQEHGEQFRRLIQSSDKKCKSISLYEASLFHQRLDCCALSLKLRIKYGGTLIANDGQSVKLAADSCPIQWSISERKPDNEASEYIQILLSHIKETDSDVEILINDRSLYIQYLHGSMGSKMEDPVINNKYSVNSLLNLIGQSVTDAESDDGEQER